MHALIIHTPTCSNISSVSLSLFSLSLAVAPSVVLFVLISSPCLFLPLCYRLNLRRCQQCCNPSFNSLHPHMGSMICQCTCLKQEGGKEVPNAAYSVLVTRLHIMVLFPVFRLQRLPQTTYAIHPRIQSCGFICGQQTGPNQSDVFISSTKDSPMMCVAE